MNKTLLTIVSLTFAFSMYAQDTLEIMRKSKNVIAFGILDKYSPRAEIDDTTIRRNTILDIAKLYKTGWTENDISTMMEHEKFPTKIDLLNSVLPDKKNIKFDEKAVIAQKDTAFYDWIELGYKNSRMKTSALFIEAQKTDKKALKSDYEPWIMIALEERFGYTISEIRKELKERKITRVYFEIRNSDYVRPPADRMNVPPPPPPPMPAQEPSVDEVASFPGGPAALKEFISKNMKYPASALEAGIQGKVYIKFTVKKTGEIKDIVVVRKLSGCPECDIEAVRLVRSMPKWVPGKLNGQAVDSYFNYPVVFKIPG